MSAQPPVESGPSQHRPSPNKTASQRLAELRRALQRQLRRKGTAVELAALDHCALVSLRCEMALLDPKSDSNDIVRLSNIKRRAEADFQRVCRIEPPRPRKQQRSMADIEKELRAHG